MWRHVRPVWVATLGASCFDRCFADRLPPQLQTFWEVKKAVLAVVEYHFLIIYSKFNECTLVKYILLHIGIQLRGFLSYWTLWTRWMKETDTIYNSQTLLVQQREWLLALVAGRSVPSVLYRVSLSLEAPNYCLCIQSNSASFSFVNTGKQVHLKHARRHFERNLVKDVYHQSVAPRNWLKS